MKKNHKIILCLFLACIFVIGVLRLLPREKPLSIKEIINQSYQNTNISCRKILILTTIPENKSVDLVFYETEESQIAVIPFFNYNGKYSYFGSGAVIDATSLNRTRISSHGIEPQYTLYWGLLQPEIFDVTIKGKNVHHLYVDGVCLWYYWNNTSIEQDDLTYDIEYKKIT